MSIVQMILMTKSYKDYKYCISGINIENKEWIRLVSNKGHNNAISKHIFDNDPSKECLDIVEVELLEHVPLGCQKENYLIDEKKEIFKVGEVKLAQILNDRFLSKKSDYIFGNCHASISEAEALKMDHSLEFVEVENLHIMCNSDRYYGSLTNKCSFIYNGKKYWDISLTDPDYRREEYDGITFKRAAIVVSLPSEPYEFDGEFHKFVAKIYE